MMHRFTSDGRSLATGQSWKEGDPVPPGFPLLGAMLASGAAETIHDETHKYEDMTFEELSDLLRERSLKISGNKQEKIDRLYDDDKGGNK